VANEEQLEILKQGVRAWNEWRVRSNPVIDLTDASLPGIDLSSVDVFTRLELFHADLAGADLAGANFGGASLVHANLLDTNLRGSSLAGAELWGANLDYADLTNALLYDTDFSETSVIATDFRTSVMDGTIFSGVDLRRAKGLDAIRHEGPCRIDIETIYLSEGNIPDNFMRGIGAPESFIAYMKSLVVDPLDYYSCFLSYSSRDQKFADLLHSQLQGKRIRVWLATEDLKIGDRFRARIDEAIRLYDKLLLVLSKDSVKSSWVQSEVEAAFERERKQKRTVLFPIRLDDTVMETEDAWAAEIRRTRHIGDFCKWRSHGSFEKSLARLLRDLKHGE
jgi:uncharacterized protein YjbI with pentapeptide repeats